MRKFVGVIVCLTVVLTTAGLVFGQTKTITGEKQTITGTIEAIQADTREVTVKGEKGNYVTFTAPAETKKFSEMKVGDTITATYYENVVLRVKAPGEKDVDTAKEAVTPSSSKKPGATASTQRTITATITEIDAKIPSITFTGPNNWKYSSKVVDTKALAKVKVGDKVDITWTEAVLISVQAPKK
jgi:hypothetical protein